VSFAATKLPFVTSRLRPSAAPRSFYNAAIQMTSELRNLSLSAFNPLGQHCSWSRDALGQGVVWVTPGWSNSKSRWGLVLKQMLRICVSRSALRNAWNLRRHCRRLAIVARQAACSARIRV